MAHTGLQNPQCTLETLRHCQGIKPMYQIAPITGEAPPATGASRSFRPVSRRNGKPCPLTPTKQKPKQVHATSSRDQRDDPVGALFALPFP
jgi:hypothetical protein